MRVLAIGSMYPPHYLGGQEVVWRQATLHQRAAGHEVRVLTSDYRRPDLPDVDELDTDVHRELRWYWHDHDFPVISAVERIRLERHNARVLRRHLADLRPDAIEWWAMGGMSLSLLEQGRATGLPALGVVCDDWMLYADDVDRWLRLAAKVPLIGSVARIPTTFDPGPVARWLFISESLRRTALQRFQLPDTGIAHPGIDPELFRECPPRPWRWRIAYVGRIDARKGIDLAVCALAELPAEATLTIDGGGNEEHLRELKRLAAETGLDGRVTFQHSDRSAMPDVYAGADVVVFPVTWGEPWGLVPLEAMAVGRPVVATGSGGSGEYLRDGENCLLFDPGRGGPGALAAALRRVADDEGLRERLRAGGRETAAGFSQSAFEEKVLAELESLAE